MPKWPSSRSLSRRGSLVCLAQAAAGLPVWAQNDPAARRARLFVLVSRSLLGPVSVSDAQAAGTVWVQTLGKRRGFQLDVRFSVADSFEATRKSVEEHGGDLFMLDVLEYLKLQPLGLLQPLMTIAQDRGSGLQTNHLIVSRDSQVASLADLRGKALLAHSASDQQLGLVWTDSLLRDQNLGPAEHFFRSVGRAGKPSAACLPVFFGKADACVIGGAGWEALTELNPQLASKLKVLASSPAFLESLLCVHVRHTHFREELYQSLRDLHRDPEGRQLLMVFRASRLQSIVDRDADSVRELLARSGPAAGKARAVARRP